MLLRKHSPVFEFLPIESIIKKKQKQYYNALSSSDKQGNATPFITFMLGVLNEALEELLLSQNITVKPEQRIEIFHDHIRKKSFTRQTYLHYFKELSSATASRDLKQAVDNKLLLKKDNRNQTEYRFKK